MPVTPKMIIRDIRSELALTNPDYRAVGRMLADAIELLDARIDQAEKSPGSEPAEEPEIRHGDPPPVRGRKRR